LGGPDSLGFAESEQFLTAAAASPVGAVLVKKDAPSIEKAVIRVDRPREAFAAFLNMCELPLPIAVGIHPTAVVAADASVAEDVSIGAYAVVESGAKIEAGVRIYAFAYIGAGSLVKKDAVIYPHAVLYRDVVVGERTIVHAGAVIGADGFGFTWNGSYHVKVPQVGRTVLNDDVEIGACSTVDRAMLGETSIGAGSKIDNLVQIGHNSLIGRHTVIAGQSGISGSCIVGDRCTIGGQVGVRDHINICDDVVLTARSAPTKTIDEPGIYRGAPAMKFMDEMRFEAGLRKIPALVKTIRDLEKRIAQLEKGA
jgi:UDP-3-O-[3-hydroxymyristoyl] glucosamine N-acyltransferase